MDPPLPYIVMECVDGRTLRDMLKAERRLEWRQALAITSDVCAALDYSHRQGIVHRDIKPANVMLTPDGKVKVMDFGIARAVTSASATVTQTVDGHRHRPVPVARAGPRRAGRRPQRHLLHRLPAVRAAHRRPAVLRRQPGGDRLPARPRGPGPAVAGQPAGAGGGRRHRDEGAGEVPCGALPVGVGDAQRHAARARRPAGPGAGRDHGARRIRDHHGAAGRQPGWPATQVYRPSPTAAGHAAGYPGAYGTEPPQKQRSKWPTYVLITIAVLAVFTGAALLTRSLLASGSGSGGVPVPDLSGRTVAQAQADLAQAGLTPGDTDAGVQRRQHRHRRQPGPAGRQSGRPGHLGRRDRVKGNREHLGPERGRAVARPGDQPAGAEPAVGRHGLPAGLEQGQRDRALREPQPGEPGRRPGAR